MQGLGCVHQEHLSPNAPWTQTLASKCPKWTIKAVKTLWTVCSLNTCTFRFSCWDGITLIQRISKLPSARLLWAVVRKKQKNQNNFTASCCQNNHTVWMSWSVESGLTCGKRLTTERAIATASSNLFTVELGLKQSTVRDHLTHSNNLFWASTDITEGEGVTKCC